MIALYRSVDPTVLRRLYVEERLSLVGVGARLNPPLSKPSVRRALVAFGIPLRTEPRTTADKILAAISPNGQQATVQEVRGDWLRITLDNGAVAGWARWYYDGNYYIEPRAC